MQRFISITLIAILLSGCTSKTQVSDQDTSLLLRGNITLCGDGQFGEVNFASSCNEFSRANFNLGLSLLHSFEYDEAEKAFAKVIDADPSCAMGYWGVAMCNFHSLWLQSGTDYLEKGAKVLELAEPLSKSRREEDYLDAIGAFYANWETASRKERIVKFEQKMEELYQKYADDKEAAVFYALALTASADPADKSYKNQRRAGQILESLFPEQPNHPGIAHYIIHCYDYPELASLALPVARQYATIAPSSAHAQHMPSHIFTRLGLWQESINSNINSIASAQCYAQSIDSAGHWDEELHGMDYLVYAYLQVGDNQKAQEQLDYLLTFEKVFPANFKIAYSAAAIPARIALENQDWNKAAKLSLPGTYLDWQFFPWEEAILHFARGLGAARSNDIESAQQEIEVLKTLRGKLLEMNDAYKANQVHIQQLAVEAWVNFAQGNTDEAIQLMQESADKEFNTSKHPVTPGEVLPASELLGDLLFVAGKNKEALAAYEFDLEQHPNRLNGLYGAAVAAKALGDQKEASKYFQLLVEMSGQSGDQCLKIIEAKKFIETGS